MNVKITGEITQIHETQSFGNFEKRRVWIKTGGQYPQDIELEAWQNDVNLLDNYPVGCTVTCTVDVRGKLINRKDGSQSILNTLKIYKIELA